MYFQIQKYIPKYYFKMYFLNNLEFNKKRCRSNFKSFYYNLRLFDFFRTARSNWEVHKETAHVVYSILFLTEDPKSVIEIPF